MFLNYLQISGFKSFAKTLKINFKFPLTGIVGPNGTGKSNINDALLWVLGASSLKSLRSDAGSDVLFQGSKEYPPANIAEVSLCFFNEGNIFENSPAEITITRRLFRGDPNSEYLINNERVRRRDVVHLAMTAGLSKGSLAIISQAQVFHFTQMNPEERRLFFDEAAQISKFKQESRLATAKLSRTQITLEKVKTRLDQDRAHVQKLAQQKKEAEKYLKITKELKEAEINVLLYDISVAKKKLQHYEDELQSLKLKAKELRDELLRADSSLSFLRLIDSNLDSEMSNYQKQYSDYLNQINQLQTSIQEPIAILRMNDAEQLNFWKEQIKLINIKINEHNNTLVNIESELQELQEHLLIKKNEHKEFIQKTYQNQQKINLLINQKKNLSNFLLSSQQTSQKIIEHFSANDGVIQRIATIFKYEQQYQTLFQALLHENQEYIIVNEKTVPWRMIKFLQTNDLGVCAFLPLDLIQPRILPPGVLALAKECPGFINSASNLLNCTPDLELVKQHLLGDILVVRAIHDAHHLHKITNQKITIATLTGKIIFPSGKILGGDWKHVVDYQQQSSKINDDSLTKYQKQHQNFITQAQKKQEEIDSLLLKINQKSKSNGFFEAKKKALEEQLFHIKHKYFSHSGEDISSQALDQTSKNLGSQKKKVLLEQKITKLRNTLNDLQQQKKTQRQKMVNLENKINNYRNLSLSTENKINKIIQKSHDCNLIMQKNENILLREYNLTFLAAQKKHTQNTLTVNTTTRASILKLRSILEEININDLNLRAIQEYEEIANQNTEEIKKYEQIWSTLTSLVDVIEKLNHKIKKISQDFIEDVNKQLSETFGKLFYKGIAKLNFIDNKDLINSGVDIIVQLPGKKISNINLLSGGEKTLVALAVLFAVLKVSAHPLVFLDEVEASLDPANTDRIAHYLKKFSNKTQFIVVTHRYETMSYCDELLGTTMNQNGVTEIIKINLKQAKKMIKK